MSDSRVVIALSSDTVQNAFGMFYELGNIRNLIKNVIWGNTKYLRNYNNLYYFILFIYFF